MASSKKITKLYPHDEWHVVEESFDYKSNARDETIFTVGNGLIGMRGGFEEGYAGPQGTSFDGTYINGFYDSMPMAHPEPAYGWAENRQTMLNVTNSKIIELRVDGEVFKATPGETNGYRRTLDLKSGTLSREVLWKTSTGKELKIEIERFVSLTRNRVAAFKYSVTPLNFSGTISITSALNGEVYNRMTKDDPRVGSFFTGQVLELREKHQDELYSSISSRTKTTHFSLVCGMHNSITSKTKFTVSHAAPAQRVDTTFTLEAKQGEPCTLEKIAVYCHSKLAPEKLVNKESLETIAHQEAVQAAEAGYTALRAEQVKFVEKFWSKANVNITGDVETVQGLRFNLFQLLQSVGRDGETNIASKGVTGEGYEGHYFWDTETYVLPVFLYTMPGIARALLSHRYSLLDKARARAKELSFNGALFAWRTIGGEELSAFFPAGTAQFHINADIIYALKKYFRATDDKEFMYNQGAEMLFEVARFWRSFGDFIPGKGFCLNCVTGPDEYTTLVNNNTFTNIMAKDNLEFAVEIARQIKEEGSKQHQDLRRKIGLTDEEVDQWERAAKAVYLHFDEKKQIFGQDDSFLDKKVWEFKKVPDAKRPFLMHFHYLYIYRYQVIKQADTVLAMFMQGDRFSRLEKVRAYDYYEPLTTHDSSLSLCIHSIVAAEIGYEKQAYEYYAGSARMDLDDTHNNVSDGIHCAAMAGSWMSLTFGFGGMREYDGKLHFAPIRPEEMKGYSFNINFRGRSIGISVESDTVKYSLLDGKAIEIYHRGEVLNLTADKVQEVPLKPTKRGVIFDLDGVITDSAEYHYHAWKKLADELDIPFDKKFNENLKGVSRDESLALILKRSNNEYTAEQRSEFANRKNSYYVESLKKLTSGDVLPGAIELLRDLRKAGIKTGLASVSRNAKFILEQLKIADLFDTVVDAATLKFGKPDPEIFIRAAEQLNLPYSSCVGVEDAAVGVTAIRKSGMPAVGIGSKDILKEATVVVPTIKDLTVETLLSL